MERLNGKVALIIGAGKGIGKAIAIAYAKQGIKICCIARTLNDIELTVNEIKTLGGEAIGILCDVTNYENLEISIQKAFNQFGHIDILVINAGTDCEKLSVDKLDIEEWIKNPEDVIDLAIFLAGQPDIGPTAQSFSLMRRDI